MSWKKGCLAAAGGVLVLVGVILAVVFYATSGAVRAGDSFLEAVGKGDLTAAYSETAAAFQAQQDEAAFTAAIRELGLADYASRSWSSRSVEGGRATLQGTFTNRAGESIPLEMTLVKADGKWKVFSLSGSQAGAAVERPGSSEATAAPATAPAPSELAALSTGSILALNRSIVAQDFSVLYGEVSKIWQAQTTPEELATAFQSFVDNEIDLHGVTEVEPVFDAEPAIDSDGVMTLSGSYPTTPVRVVFTLRYVRENAGWKLLGIQVDLKE